MNADSFVSEFPRGFMYACHKNAAVNFNFMLITHLILICVNQHFSAAK